MSTSSNFRLVILISLAGGPPVEACSQNENEKQKFCGKTIKQYWSDHDNDDDDDDALWEVSLGGPN